MCGIAGYCGLLASGWLEQSCALLSHRGPDGEGIYLDPESRQAGLVHRRLAILDLSDAGRQPMESLDGRYVLSYNGEIYNFRDLRKDLEACGRRFRSTSDTEVLLAAWQEWGSKCLNRFNGIFAFGIWDRQSKEITLVRDPVGVKPLYWGQNQDKTLFFASELTPLLHAPGIDHRLSTQSLDSYLAFLWIPSSETLFESVHMLPPGHKLTCRPGQDPEVSVYANLYSDLLQRRPPAAQEPDDLWHQLQACVQRQMISDVPVGAFLSGGLDSTGIVAACSDRSSLTAYTIAFSKTESDFEATSNDLEYSKEAAKALGVRHQILHVDSDITHLLPRYLAAMDQPVGDHAPLASYLICQAAASQGAKVLLSGQGADEIFGGYPWHRAGYFSFIYNRLPESFRRRQLEPWISRMAGAKGGKWQGNIRRLKRFAQSASLPWPERYPALCRYLTPVRREAMFTQPRARPAVPAENLYLSALEEAAGLTPLAQMMYADLKTFLPGLNLFYTDRTSMAHGVEVRVPYLDLEMIRFAFQIPDSQKIQGLDSKIILKEALKPHIPSGVLRRRKAGFGLPIRSWMRTSLLPLIQEHLSAESLRRRGIWDPKQVEALLAEHQSGREDRAYLIFALLVFEMWMKIHIDSVSEAGGQQRTPLLQPF